MVQVSLLLYQYHDLLTQTLDDKEHYHEEERGYTDKVSRGGGGALPRGGAGINRQGEHWGGGGSTTTWRSGEGGIHMLYASCLGAVVKMFMY